MKIRTRMAPSPTGDMHVGSLAIALKNYAFAKRHNGQFILRIEDTDKTREVEGGVNDIQDILNKYGIIADEGPKVGGEHGPYIQSQRLEIYQKYSKKLLDNGNAYHCFCTHERLEQVKEEQKSAKVPPKYDGHCRNLSKDEVKDKLAANAKFVTRLKVPTDEQIVFTDVIRGEITINSNTINDQVLMKSDGYPTYHMAVVVDDHLMGITYIMRGEEWISSTPKHILLYKAFGWELPQFAHIPVFLNPDGKGKMSKRKGTVSAQSFLERGYLPQALLNFFMILGWAREDEVEIMTMDDYIERYDPKDMSPKSVVFDLKKLDWINGIYIRKFSIEELSKKIAPFLPKDFPTEKLSNILPLVQDRLEKFSDIEELTSFIYRDIEQPYNLLVKKSNPENSILQLETTKKALSQIDTWSVESVEKVIRSLQEENDWKRGQYFMMIRVVSTGKKATPPLFDTVTIIGKTQMLNRIDQALSSLRDN